MLTLLGCRYSHWYSRSIFGCLSSSHSHGCGRFLCCLCLLGSFRQRGRIQCRLCPNSGFPLCGSFFCSRLFFESLPWSCRVFCHLGLLGSFHERGRIKCRLCLNGGFSWYGSFFGRLYLLGSWCAFIWYLFGVWGFFIFDHWKWNVCFLVHGHWCRLGCSTRALKRICEIRINVVSGSWGSTQHAVNNHVRSGSKLHLARVRVWAKWST